MKTPEEILKEKGIDDKLEIDTTKPFPKGLRYVTTEAMKEYADQEVAAERERIKKEIKSKITFWNSATEKANPKYSYKDIFELIDSL